jgi:hypothetical protein
MTLSVRRVDILPRDVRCICSRLPTAARNSGAGFGLGIGRGDSLIAPILVELLFQRGHTLAGVSTIVALGSLIGAAAVFTLSLPTHLDR